MKQLVACGACKRQYDASKLTPGDRFHCHCGEIVEVKPPSIHQAKVVKCPACGGPRGESVERCVFCDASFHFDERRLNTLCPECFLRIPDGSAFCPSCGIGIQTALDAGSETKEACPACQEKHLLISRRLTSVEITILECGTCTGMWLSKSCFEQLVTKASKSSPIQDIQAKGPDRAIPVQTGPLYRECVTCASLMVRKNFGRTSGVIVDFCRDHGVWLDAMELDHLLHWARTKGSKQVQDTKGTVQGAPPPPSPSVPSFPSSSGPALLQSTDRDYSSFGRVGGLGYGRFSFLGLGLEILSSIFED